MTREEAKAIFLNRGYVEVDNGTYYSPDKWIEACVVISEWLEQQPCEDAISRKSLKHKLQEHHDFFVNAYGGFSNLPQNDKSRVDEITNCIAMVVNEPSVKPQESCDVPDTNVGDIISKQAVLDTISELNAISFYEAQEDSKECYYELRQAIKDLSPVKPQESKWIPVSKRLPELNKPLLVTTYHRVYYGHLISESGNYGYPVFRIHGLGDKNRDWVQETMSHEPYSLGRIDAWMYLDIPEPYKVSEIPTGSEPQERSDKE